MKKIANSYVLNDVLGVLKGFQSVIEASISLQQQECRTVWKHSSIRTAWENTVVNVEQGIEKLKKDELNVAKVMEEAVGRTNMVVQGVRTYAKYSSSQDQSQNIEGVSPEDLLVKELDYKDQLLIKRLEREHELKLQKERETVKAKQIKVSEKAVETLKPTEVNTVPAPEVHTKESIKPGGSREEEKEKNLVGLSEKIMEPTVKKSQPKRQTLNPEARQRRVPSTRIGRMVSFGSLAAGLGLGTVAEVARRTLGITPNTKSDKPATLDTLFLTEANAERIVNTLCRVRGAALKIGQILSIQDNNIISPGLQKAFERVRQSADFMPSWQVEKVLIAELGKDWRNKVLSFEERPFAAASIGQVHLVTLVDGRECAMKIQYPGVAQGIKSDIDNLVGILKVWNVFPEGLFIDNLVEVAKRELAWEVDYEREKECTERFKKLVEPYPQFLVPNVIDELCTKQVFTTELIEGTPVDQCVNMDSKSRERVASLVMELCLRELFEFRYMQTDPNWSNFFYNPNTQQLALLDFGASREYDKAFMDQYIEVTKGAADRDRQKVLDLSRKMGFLTGYESKIMEDAHVDAVMILGEVFSSVEPFDFGAQDTTLRIQKLLPTIVYHRLCPPPEQIYSLHRKLSGVFLLCTKLKVKISCRDMFLQVYENYKKN